jgi:hypothetical protein
MAQAIAASADAAAERRKALLRIWTMGTFDAAAAGLEKASPVAASCSGKSSTRSAI